MRMLTTLPAIVASLLSVLSARGEEAPRQHQALEEQLRQAERWPGVIRSHLGVTRNGTRIPCVVHRESLDPRGPQTRVLLVAGFQEDGTTAHAMRILNWFYTSKEAAPLRKTFYLSAVPLVNPDGASPPKFPPQGEAYHSKDNAEAEYLWRWIGMHGPDLVVALTAGASANGPKPNRPPESSAVMLTDALTKHSPCNTGTVGVAKVSCDAESPAPEKQLNKLLQITQHLEPRNPSSARRELQQRIEREPLEIARQLAKVYGQSLSSVEYIPALALVGRMWLGELTDDASHRKDVEGIVAPYVSGKKPALPDKFSGSHLAGHLVFAELARTSDNKTEAARYLEMARSAADTGFDAQGKPKAAMPAHNEMSDAVFMGCPILVEAGVQGGEEKYLGMAATHFDFMRTRVLREDGIYRHSPLCETAWGRGNGFPALGLAWSLSQLDKKHPLHAKFLKEFQNHMASLVKHQDPTGMWHQVVDDPASYRELSCTCMITFAMIRGIRQGWLKEEEYRPVIEKAFDAVKTRIAADGTLVDVCTGTGKQKTLRDYYDRPAILGRDARGGAMALLVTTEMARWQRETK